MSGQALEGIKVLDFSWVVAGPLTAEILALHGATVIRLESTHHMDVYRTSPPYKDGIATPDRSALFALYNAGKYGMALNLAHPKGREVARKLLCWADVAVENFTPGVMERWGLDYEHVRAVNPRLIMMSMALRGQKGPDAKQPAFGTTMAGLIGMNYVTGWPDGDPMPPYGAYSDFITPQFAIPLMVAALIQRAKTGQGMYIDLSQFEAAIQFISPLVLDYEVNGRVATQRKGNRCDAAAPHGVYRCRSHDSWCAIGVFSEQEWLAFGATTDDATWAREARFASLSARKANEDELDRLVESWTVNMTAEEVMDRLQKAGVEAMAVKNPAQVLEDPQLNSRGQFMWYDHPVIGRYFCRKPGFSLSKTPAMLLRPAPSMGEHTEWVCREILKMPDDEFLALLQDGVLE